MHKILLFPFLLLSIHAVAQSDSMFVTKQNGTNVVAINAPNTTNLSALATRLNVSTELLGLFNTYTTSDKINENAIVIIPLVETNYYKNASIAANQGFVPIYYKTLASDKVADVSRSFLITEAILYKWNQINSQQLAFGQILQVGWLKDNASIFVKKAESKTTVYTDNNLIYSPNKTFKDDIKSDYNNAKIKISKTFKNLGTGIKKLTNSTSKLQRASNTDTIQNTTVASAMNSDITTKTNTAKINNSTTIEVDSAAVLATIPSKSNTNNFKKGFDNTTKIVGKTFTQIGSSINSGIAKLGGNKNKSYQKEQIEKEARIKLENEKMLAANKATKTMIATTPKKELADAEIVNNDVKTTSVTNDAKEEITIPAYKAENEDAVIYKNEKPIQKPIDADKPIKKVSTEIVENTSNTIKTEKKISPKSGKAITFYAGANGMHLAYTDYAPKGTRILVENKKNGKKIEATVLGSLQKNDDTENGIFILLSDTVKKELNPTGENFLVEISRIAE
jgi:hypothetical protein